MSFKRHTYSRPVDGVLYALPIERQLALIGSEAFPRRDTENPLWPVNIDKVLLVEIDQQIVKTAFGTTNSFPVDAYVE